MKRRDPRRTRPVWCRDDRTTRQTTCLFWDPCSRLLGYFPSLLTHRPATPSRYSTTPVWVTPWFCSSPVPMSSGSSPNTDPVSTSIPTAPVPPPSTMFHCKSEGLRHLPYSPQCGPESAPPTDFGVVPTTSPPPDPVPSTSTPHVGPGRPFTRSPDLTYPARVLSRRFHQEDRSPTVLCLLLVGPRLRLRPNAHLPLHRTSVGLHPDPPLQTRSCFVSPESFPSLPSTSQSEGPSTVLPTTLWGDAPSVGAEVE